MAVLAQVDIGASIEAGLARVFEFLPKFIGFLAILVIGYFVAKAVAKVVDAVLERVGFDRAVERGGVKRALEKSRYDASGILSKIVFYAIFLFVLTLAFGLFGENPISDLLYAVIAFLPKIFVAILIIVVASAIAAAIKEIVSASLGGLPYGNILANVASGAILVVGLFAALNQIEIAPAIINGLFYALLAVIAGSAIIAIGGGGVVPMRQQWERALSRVEEEGPRLREEASGSSEQIKQRAQQARTAGASEAGDSQTVRISDQQPGSVRG